MDQIEDVALDLHNVKGEHSIIVKLREGFKETKLILTNQVCLCFTYSVFFSAVCQKKIEK